MMLTLQNTNCEGLLCLRSIISSKEASKYDQDYVIAFK